MIVLDCPQGSPEWVQARLGIPTASVFSEILTAKTLKYSASASKLIARLLAERIIGEPCDMAASAFMERGTEMEDEAFRWFQLTQADNAKRVGFCARDDWALGCSPDFLIGEDGGGEIKCPGAKKHVEYLLNPQALVDDYWQQIQGSLYVTNRAYWMALSYNPAMPQVLRRVEPDGDYLCALDDAVKRFLAELDAAWARLADMGCTSALDRREIAKADDKAKAEAFDAAMWGDAPSTDESPPKPTQDDYDFDSIPY